MKAFEIYRNKIFPGIRVTTYPFHFVALGRSDGKQHLRIAVGIKDIEALIVKREWQSPFDTNRSPQVLSLIEDANVIPTKQPGKMIIVKPYPTDDRVLIKWALPSAPQGTARFLINSDLHRMMTIVGNDKAINLRTGVETDEIMFVLKKQQSLSGLTTFQQEQIEYAVTWDGYMLRTKKKYLVNGNVEEQEHEVFKKPAPGASLLQLKK